MHFFHAGCQFFTPAGQVLKDQAGLGPSVNKKLFRPLRLPHKGTAARIPKQGQFTSTSSANIHDGLPLAGCHAGNL